MGRFTSADSIVPDGVQGYDRYAYVNNSPLRYTDPSGHCADKDWCSHLKPDPGGQQALNTLRNLNLLGNNQDALEYLIRVEVGPANVSPYVNQTSPFGNSQGSNTFQGMTNRYQTFCQGGAFSASCLNGFWAYHQPFLTGGTPGTYGTIDNYDQNTIIENMASAIQQPGVTFGAGTPEAVTAATSGDVSGWNGGCGDPYSGNICQYANATDDMRNNFFPKIAPFGYSYANGNQVIYAFNVTATDGSAYVALSNAMYTPLRNTTDPTSFFYCGPHCFYGQ